MLIEKINELIRVKETELKHLREMLDLVSDNNVHVQFNLVSEISSATVELNRLTNLKLAIAKQKGE